MFQIRDEKEYVPVLPQGKRPGNEGDSLFRVFTRAMVAYVCPFIASQGHNKEQDIYLSLKEERESVLFLFLSKIGRR